MADAAPDSKKHLMMTAIVILLLTLMGAGVGFAVGVFLKPGDSTETAGAQVADGSQDPQSPGVQAEGKEADAPHDKAGHGSESAEGGDAEAESTDVSGEEEKILPNDLAVVSFSPVLTTLRSPKNKWIRLEGSILVNPSAEIPHEQLSERAGEQILSYLRTADLAQIEGPSGFLALRNDLNETLRTLSNGDVQGLLIHGLVVE